MSSTATATPTVAPTAASRTPWRVKRATYCRTEAPKVGIGAVVLENAELQAAYVSPEGARRGCGSALVREIERIARNNEVASLTLDASLNAERFYADVGYNVLERTEPTLPNGQTTAAVRMAKNL